MRRKIQRNLKYSLLSLHVLPFESSMHLVEKKRLIEEHRESTEWKIISAFRTLFTIGKIGLSVTRVAAKQRQRSLSLLEKNTRCKTNLQQ